MGYAFQIPLVIFTEGTSDVCFGPFAHIVSALPPARPVTAAEQHDRDLMETIWGSEPPRSNIDLLRRMREVREFEKEMERKYRRMRC